MLYEKNGQDHEALNYCEKAHAILVEILSANDPCLATSFNNLALAQYRNKQFNIALENFHKSLLIFSQILPTEDPQIIKVQQNINEVNSEIAHEGK